MTSGGVYQPQLIDIPLIDRARDIRIDGGIAILSTAYTTVTYGITDKIELQAFGNVGKNGICHAQGAVGYFKDFGHKNILEWYLGLGYGHSNFDYNSAWNDSPYSGTYGGGYDGPYMYEIRSYQSGNYQEYFTQLNYGLIGLDFANLDFGLSLKAGYLFSDMRDYDFHRYSVNGELIDRYTNQSIILQQLAFVRLGSKKLKICLKVGDSWIYKLSKSDRSIPYVRLNTGIGLNYNF
jgi:hypothetical protein